MRLISGSHLDGHDLPALADADALYGAPRMRPPGRPALEICMITTLDGVTSIGGRSGPLGGPADRSVLAALRRRADWVLVGGETVRAENYRRPTRTDLRVAVVTASGDIAAAPELASSGIVTLVMPEDSPPSSLPTLRAGRGRVDLAAAVGLLDGDFVHVEGGPSLNAQLLAADLVDAINLTIAPTIGGGPFRPVFDAVGLREPSRFRLRWTYEADGFLFARYERAAAPAGSTVTSA